MTVTVSRLWAFGLVGVVLLGSCGFGSGDPAEGENALEVARRFPELADVDDLVSGERIAFDRTDGSVSFQGYGSSSVYQQVYVPREGFDLDDVHVELTERVLAVPGWELSDRTTWCASPSTGEGFAQISIIEDSAVRDRPPNVLFELRHDVSC